MKIGPILLLLFLTSTVSAQVDDRLFADYVHSVVQCCLGRSVVVFYTGAEPFVFRKYLEGFQPDQAVTMVALDDPSKGFGPSIKPHLTSRTVAVAYDLGPDAIRVLADAAEKSDAITISTTEEDVYVTSFSFDSVVSDRFRSSRTPAGCNLEKCTLTFHSDRVEPNTMARRAIKTFLDAHGKLEPLRKERTGTTRNEAALLLKNPRERASLVKVAHLLQEALRFVPGETRLNFKSYVSEDRMLNGEWNDLYAPHHDLGEVFAYFANCEAAEIEWTASSRTLKQVAPTVLKELERIRKQSCG
ncbi:MAG: hypothetical protein QOF63_912 [Thermoanaerobaculia bacterium]|jgi:hypothetical protein|nr:hypothetical protein [Thermoanaerobaculia bacterium]